MVFDFEKQATLNHFLVCSLAFKFSGFLSFKSTLFRENISFGVIDSVITVKTVSESFYDFISSFFSSSSSDGLFVLTPHLFSIKRFTALSIQLGRLLVIIFRNLS